MKIFSTAFVLLGVLFTSNSSLQAASGPFTDVTWDHNFAFAINYLKQQRIVEGYNDGTYRPEYLINRAELIKIIVERNYATEDIKKCTNSGFDDVPQNAWFAPYICTAVKNNLVKGYPDGTFKPAQNINFVEASKIVYLAYGQPEKVDTPWYKPYVVFLHANNAIPSSLSKLDESINRGEMAEMIYRLRNFAQQARNITPKVQPNNISNTPDPVIDFDETSDSTTFSGNTGVNINVSNNTAPDDSISNPVNTVENQAIVQPEIQIQPVPTEANQTTTQPTITPAPTLNQQTVENQNFENYETAEAPQHFGSESENGDTDYFYKFVDIQSYCPPHYQCTEVLAFYRDGRVKLQLGSNERWANGDRNEVIQRIANADVFNKSCPIEGFSNAAKTHYVSYNGQTRKFYEPECQSDLEPIKSFVRSYFPEDQE